MTLDLERINFKQKITYRNTFFGFILSKGCFSNYLSIPLKNLFLAGLFVYLNASLLRDTTARKFLINLKFKDVERGEKWFRNCWIGKGFRMLSYGSYCLW
jgi:hypothetical protein